MAGRNTEVIQTENTKDGSVDLNGNPVIRSTTGGWKACSFIVVYELFERMSFCGIALNLVIYLTNRLHLGTVDAANNVTNWVGTVYLTPILGAYVADSYLGRYWTILIGSVVYFSGMVLLTVAVSLPTLRPSNCNMNCRPAFVLKLGVFYAGLYLVALGNGGTKSNISTLGADQFDEFDTKEKMHKISFFNWWTFSIFLGALFASTVLVYIQDNVGWSVGYGLPTLGLLLSVMIFLSGTKYYRHKVPQGSPFTEMARVIVSAIWKRSVPLPNDPKELHELSTEWYEKRRKFRIAPSETLRFLNRASVKHGKSNSKWSLCPVTQVEETKQILCLVPFLIALLIPCALLAQLNTLFIKQATTLDRRIGPHFQIPAASLGAFVMASMLVSVVLYDQYFVNIVRMWTRNPRGITLLQRIGVGLVIQIIAMMVASFVDKIRLSIARSHGLDKTTGQIPATIFILMPQFALVGIAEAFLVVGQTEFFYDQAPENMKSLGASFSLTAYGIGNFLSSFILKLTHDITSRSGKGWILNNLNASRLDNYYAFLTVLGAFNFAYFFGIAKFYCYKSELCEQNDVSVPEIDFDKLPGCQLGKSKASEASNIAV